MDLQELLDTLQQQTDEIDSVLSTAENEIMEARRYADGACSDASSAEEQAGEAEGSIESAQAELEGLRETLGELQEYLEALDTDEEVSGLSDLQRDILRWKSKVLKLKSLGASIEQIAQRLEIGSFLVNRILELEKA